MYQPALPTLLAQACPTSACQWNQCVHGSKVRVLALARAQVLHRRRAGAERREVGGLAEAGLVRRDAGGGRGGRDAGGLGLQEHGAGLGAGGEVGGEERDGVVGGLRGGEGEEREREGGDEEAWGKHGGGRKAELDSGGPVDGARCSVQRRSSRGGSMEG